jgi:hypothetical protein
MKLRPQEPVKNQQSTTIGTHGFKWFHNNCFGFLYSVIYTCSSYKHVDTSDIMIEKFWYRVPNYSYLLDN